jgi:putative hydrolase of the HAD superfamily
MGKIGPIKGVLFDLDQTLTDRQQSLRKAAKLFAQHYAAELKPVTIDTIYSCFKQADVRVHRRLFTAELCETLPWKTAPSARDLLQFWNTHFPQCTVESAGATDVLRELVRRGIRVGIVSNGEEKPQNEKIDAMNIRRFLACVIVEEAVGISKPEAGIYQLALKELNVPARFALFVGENPRSDVIVPRKLGLHTIWIPGVFLWPKGAPPPSHSIQNLREILDLITT